MNHLGTVKLETKRLILRRFELNDYKDMYNNWANDDLVTKYMSWSTHQNEEVSKAVINMWIEEYKQINNYQWCIALKEDNVAIGSISLLHQNDDKKEVEFGYCISRKHWNKGITTEALKAVIEFAFSLGYTTIIGKHAKDNPASGKVMLKNGLTFVKEELGKNNQNEDCIIYVYELKK